MRAPRSTPVCFGGHRGSTPCVLARSRVAAARVAHRWGLLAALLAAAGCTAQVPVGVFSCSTDADCPRQQSCIASICGARGSTSTRAVRDSAGAGQSGVVLADPTQGSGNAGGAGSPATNAAPGAGGESAGASAGSAAQPVVAGTGSDAGVATANSTGGSGAPNNHTPSPVAGTGAVGTVVDSGVPSVCTGTTVCTADYPCEAADAGYRCRGQFLDYPITTAPPSSAFTVNGSGSNGTVIDSRTKLEWQQTVPGTYADCTGMVSTPGDSCSWFEAKAHCASLALRGTGWRLPTRVEVMSILDFSAPGISGAIAQPDDAVQSRLWTASLVAGQSNEAWRVSAGGAKAISPDPTANSAWVLCVRNMQ
jgi:hypothetical protein